MALSITLRQLEIFSEVASRGSLAGAAQSLRLGQPAVSEALRELEHRLDCPLFDRSGRRLKLNAAGRAFQQDAKQILAEAERLIRRHSGREHLTIGASVTVGNYILPPLVSAMLRAEPDVEITVVVRNTEAIVQALLNREIEAAIVEGHVAHGDLDVRPWRQDEQVIVAAPGHPLARATDIMALADASWILRETGSGTREAFDAAAASWPFTPNIQMTLGGNELLKHVVATGAGLGCLSLAAAMTEISRGELVPVRPQGVSMQRVLRFVQMRGRPAQPALLRFIRCWEELTQVGG